MLRNSGITRIAEVIDEGIRKTTRQLMNGPCKVSEQNRMKQNRKCLRRTKGKTEKEKGRNKNKAAEESKVNEKQHNIIRTVSH